MLERFRKKKLEPRQPEPAFKADVKEIDSFKVMLKTQKCPGCEQVGLILRSFERGPDGFEAKVACSNCGTYGTINHTGFNFQHLTMKKSEASKVPVVMR